MKHVFTKIVGKVIPGNPLQASLRLINGVLAGVVDPKELKDYEDNGGLEDAEFGYCFMPEDNDPTHCALVTKREFLDKYITNHNEEENYLESFFGAMGNNDPGFIDNWNDDLLHDENIHVYYTLFNGSAHEFILSERNNGLHYMPINQNAKDLRTGIQQLMTNLIYMSNIDGRLMDCEPEEGDYIFDTKEEAEAYYPIYLEEVKQKVAEIKKYQEELEKQKEWEAKVESLGDGTYIGQMAGNRFYYQGGEFVCPIAIRQSFPANVILEIKNGKVSFRDWGTPYDKWLGK